MKACIFLRVEIIQCTRKATRISLQQDLNNRTLIKIVSLV